MEYPFRKLSPEQQAALAQSAAKAAERGLAVRYHHSLRNSAAASVLLTRILQLEQPAVQQLQREAAAVERIVGIEAPIVFGAVSNESRISIQALMVESMTGRSIAYSRQEIGSTTPASGQEAIRLNPKFEIEDLDFAKSQIAELGRVGLRYGDITNV